MPTYLEQTGAEVQEILNRPEIKRNSQLINDEGYINREEDPTVPSWSKQPNKPTYTAEEVGAMPADAAFKTINGESVKGSGNINTDAIEIQNSPRLVAPGDVFDEYFGVSAVDLLKRGICGFFGDEEENYQYIYYKVSGSFPLEDLGDGPTVVFDDGTTRSTIYTRDEEGTIYIDRLSEEPSKVELQQSLTPGSTTKAPSVTAVKNRIEPIEAKIPAEASSSNKLTDKAYVDGKVAVVDEKVGDIEDIIPDQASALNKLADKAFVNSSVQTATANFRGTYSNLIAIPSNPNWYPEDYAGGRTPTTNDYLVVADIVPSEYQWEANHQYSVGQFVFDDQGDYPTYYHCIQAVSSSVIPDQDEEHWEVWFYADAYDGEGITGTWRFKYTGNWDTNGKFGWQPEYQVNETPMTAAQLAALNSNITKAKVTKFDAMQALIDRINRDFGRYDNPVNVVLAVGVNGKYIDKDSAQEVSNGSYAISTPLSLAAGDILLVPSASAVSAACSVVSRKVTKTYNKVTIYTYTYDEYGRIASATADYNASLVYTAHYASGEETTPDYWTRGADQYDTLPSTHEVTESFYEPLVKQSVAAMPSEGYYVYLASSSMEVVVSAFTATINGGIAIKVGWGIFKNIATNFVGIDKQRVIAEAIAELEAKVEGIEDKLLNGLSKLKVGHLMVDRAISGLNVNGTFCLQAAGAPSASLVPVNWDAETYGDWKGIPQFIGQEYANTTNRIIYKAIGVSAVSDWLRISNA